MALKAMLCSSLEKIFSDSSADYDFRELSLLSGEKGNFQIVLKSDCDCTVSAVSDFPGVQLTQVKEIYAGKAIDKEECGDILLLKNGDSGYYPDLLDTFSGETELKKDKATALWVNVDSAGLPAGRHEIRFTVSDKKQTITLCAALTVVKACLPRQQLIHINWFHCDCLATYYKVPVFSEEHWQIIENFVKNAVDHGVNCLLTPLFTPPLDTEEGKERPTVQLVGVKRCRNYRYEFNFNLLDRWVDMCLRNGVRYFELSHLFTQWGAKHAPKIMAETSKGTKRIFGWETKATSDSYMNFLRQFGEALKEYTDKKGITELCFIHCSDEPGLQDIAHYKKASDAVRKYFSAYEHIDALSDYDFYKEGLIGTPVPEEGNIEAFAGNFPSLWPYYCCGQFRDNLPNRFFAMPAVKTRILGVLLYKYNCTGFLQWGFNFYYSQLSKREIDPFTVTDADGAFPSGDAFVVYPGKDGTPLSSLRQKVFYDGFQDIAALRALEDRYSREYALELISEQLGDISFTSYPMEPERLLAFREKLNSLLDN